MKCMSPLVHQPLTSSSLLLSLSGHLVEAEDGHLHLIEADAGHVEAEADHRGGYACKTRLEIFPRFNMVTNRRASRRRRRDSSSSDDELPVRSWCCDRSTD